MGHRPWPMICGFLRFNFVEAEGNLSADIENVKVK